MYLSVCTDAGKFFDQASPPNYIFHIFTNRYSRLFPQLDSITLDIITLNWDRRNRSRIA